MVKNQLSNSNQRYCKSRKIDSYMQQMTTTLENNNDSKTGKLQQLGRITVRYKNKLSRKRV